MKEWVDYRRRDKSEQDLKIGLNLGRKRLWEENSREA